MAKKKAVAVEATPVEEVKEEVKVEEEKTKNQICEFYGISDDEVFDWDFEKYGVSKEEAAILETWRNQNRVIKAWDIEFNMYKGDEEVRAIIAKYGITAGQVASWEMDELSEEEKDIIVNYYNDLVKWL